MMASKQRAIRKKKAANPQTHKKRPGFDAFATPALVTKNRKAVAYEKPDLPETGIHSLVWAKAIVPQEQIGFLRLPYEIRLKIYQLVIKDFCYVNTKIEPVKNGKKFKSWNWPNAARDTAILAQICRQMYVDCVGGALLYKYKHFRFNSAAAMMNYLWVINPIHKEAMTSISLRIHIGAYSWSIPKKIFVLLAECRGLENLMLEFSIDRFKCTDDDYPLYLNRRGFPHDHREHYNWRRVPWNDLEKIENSEMVRDVIKGLSSFDMKFWTEEFDDNAGMSASHRLESFGDKRADCPYRRLKDNLQALIHDNQ